MAQVTVTSLEELQGLVGQTVGPTDWREVTQELINTFAEVSGDHQWIHLDVDRAREESPYGTTIAHGNFTLSAIDGLRGQLFAMPLVKMAVNYGWDKVRFPAPVPTGSRIRTTGEMVSLDEIGAGWWQAVTRFTVEVEGTEKPACVADSVGRLLV
jgi:acyl dehydratase